MPSRSLPGSPSTYICVTKLVLVRRVHLEVDVRRAARIGNGPDRAEAVVALRIRRHAPAALEARIALAFGEPARVARMAIDAVGIALPDLDLRITDRLASGVQNFSRNVRDMAERLGRLALHQHEVVIDVAGPVFGVKWPQGLLWRDRQTTVRAKRAGNQRQAPQPSRDQKLTLFAQSTVFLRCPLRTPSVIGATLVPENDWLKSNPSVSHERSH